MENYDVVVVGGGVAGLSAAIFTSRRKLSTAVISIEYGGQTAIPIVINNYPGFEAIAGQELMDKLKTQAQKCGAVTLDGKVGRIEQDGEGFVVIMTNGEKYGAKAVVLSYGKAPRMLGIPGEDKYVSRGVFPNVIHDPKIYIGKTVAVIGGGNSAFGTALECCEAAKLVYIVNRTENFRGEETSLEKIRKTPNITLLTNKAPFEFKGDDKVVRQLVVEDAITKEKSQLEVDFVFVNIGLEVKNDFCSHLVKLNEFKEIEVNTLGETGVTGLFAAGDATNVPFKQTIISAGDGAKVGIQVYKYVKGDKSRTSADWTH